jgi:hypothetical protein
MCVQAAAAASVAGVGLGVMPLTSLALGIDPGFLSLAGGIRTSACFLMLRHYKGWGVTGVLHVDKFTHNKSDTLPTRKS